jgi:hypothetical protein
MNLFIALASVCLVIAFLASVIGLIFAILISDDYKLGKPWFEYSFTLQELKSEWHDKNKNKVKFVYKVALAFFFFLAKASMLIGVLLWAAGYFKNL